MNVTNVCVIAGSCLLNTSLVSPLPYIVFQNRLINLSTKENPAGEDGKNGSYILSDLQLTFLIHIASPSPKYF
jgi:hypothetical protein